MKVIDHIPNCCAKDFKVHQVGWNYSCVSFWLYGRWKMF
jgi:hypothetical protein